MADENRKRDELIDRTEQTQSEAQAARDRHAANLFDLRKIIGGLFVLYGAILTITGLFDTQAEIDKAAGVHINLYEGLGMLAVGALFLVWGFLRPLGRQLDEAEAGSEQPGGRAGGDR
jgi:hypothetical protein